MSPPLEIRTDRGPAGQIRLTLSGEIDLSNVDRLRTALQVPDGELHVVLVDLTGVTYIDSAGMSALFSRAAHGPLEIQCRADSIVVPLIEITRLDEVASIRKV